MQITLGCAHAPSPALGPARSRCLVSGFRWPSSACEEVCGVSASCRTVLHGLGKALVSFRDTHEGHAHPGKLSAGPAAQFSRGRGPVAAALSANTLLAKWPREQPRWGNPPQPQHPGQVGCQPRAPGLLLDLPGG